MASASPITSAAVVLEVGARFSGHASSATETKRCASDARPSVEFASPVMLINGVPRRWIRGSSKTISAEVPLFDKARTTSLDVSMPRSPCEASAGCMKNAGVPVDASVAAILLPICPDLPIPVTTIRPSQ